MGRSVTGGFAARQGAPTPSRPHNRGGQRDHAHQGRGAIFDPTHYANPQIMPELPLIPLHRQKNIWAIRKA